MYLPRLELIVCSQIKYKVWLKESLSRYLYRGQLTKGLILKELNSLRKLLHLNWLNNMNFDKSNVLLISNCL